MTDVTATKRDRSEPVRQAIREAARRRFADDGFQATGVRDIAVDAGVSPAIIIRHFGSKEHLFLETMSIPEDVVNLLDAPIAELGHTMARFVVDSARRGSLDTFAALLGASGRPEVRARLQDLFVRGFVPRIAGRLEGADAELRAHAFCAQLQGLIMVLALHLDPGLAEYDDDTVVTFYGRALQWTLSGHA